MEFGRSVVRKSAGVRNGGGSHGKGFASAYSGGAMKSHNTSFSPYRRALLAATVAIAVGSVAAIAQSSSESSSTAPSTGNSYPSDRNSSSANSTSATAGSNDTDMSRSSSASASDNSSDRNSSSKKLSWSDRRFITKVAEGNQDEIQVAQLAIQRASSPDVKNFAQQLVNDHTQLGQELQTLASSKDVQLKADTKTPHEENKLSKASGTDFDREFVKEMISEHKKDVKQFQDRVEDSKDSELKAFAQSTLPKLQHHLQMAQQLEQSIIPTGLSGNESWKSSSHSTDTNASTSSASSTPNAEGTGATSSSGSNSADTSNVNRTNR
jgi:putative membrane protein